MKFQSFLILLSFLLSTSIISAQWSVDRTTNYYGDYKIASKSDTENIAKLLVQVENRTNKGLIAIQSDNKYLGINPLSDLDYTSYGVTFKFDDDPKVYYSTYTWLIVKEHYFVLRLCDEFGTNTMIRYVDSPMIGFKEDQKYTENKDLLFKGQGWVFQPTDFLEKLKSSYRLYVAFWFKDSVKFLEFNLKGSSAAINKVFKAKYNRSLIQHSTQMTKIFSNDVLEEGNSNY